jgi:hypothetical protein
LQQQFNELKEDIVPFHAYGHRYNMKVEKRSTRTHIGGEEWRQFLAQNRLSGENGIFIFAKRSSKVL